jgi:hypothetical protein
MHKARHYVTDRIYGERLPWVPDVNVQMLNESSRLEPMTERDERASRYWPRFGT